MMQKRLRKVGKTGHIVALESGSKIQQNDTELITAAMTVSLNLPVDTSQENNQ